MTSCENGCCGGDKEGYTNQVTNQSGVADCCSDPCKSSEITKNNKTTSCESGCCGGDKEGHGNRLAFADSCSAPCKSSEKTKKSKTASCDSGCGGDKEGYNNHSDVAGSCSAPCKSSEKTRHFSEYEEDEEDCVTCLAVIRESGTEISLFDASGHVRSFKHNGDIRKLCFSSHGQDADDLLTPCFDEDGNHGTPDEGCFCGEEAPHIHAHLHDPKTCDDNGPKNGNLEKELMNLARLTLYLSEDLEDSLYNIPVSEHMPKQCNSKEYIRHLSGADSDTPPHPVRRQRMHKVKHDDHFDYLVHNKTTGDMHLEHPCDACGDHDYHGNFRLIGKRKWTSESDVHLHFFDASRRFDFMHLFEPESSRVSTLRDEALKMPHIKPCCAKGPCTSSSSKNDTCSKSKTHKEKHHQHTEEIHPGTCNKSNKNSNIPSGPDGLGSDIGSSNKNLVRSTFVCSKICCSSEVPMIKKVLEPVAGIEKIMVNVPLKNVIVDHDPDLISAIETNDILNKNHFGATIKTNGGISSENSSQGRSRFHVDKICCASEIPAIKTIVSPIEGVSNLMINVTTKTVYVDHDCRKVSADAICNALNAENFGACVEHDAAMELKITSSFSTSIFSFEAQDQQSLSTENLTDFLKTFENSHVETFFVDIPSNRITVVHNTLLLPAQDIAAALSEKIGIQVRIERDGKDLKVWEFPDAPEGDGVMVEEPMNTLPRPTVVLSGVFWVVSMLSFIGGNWDYLKYVALLAVAIGLPPIAIKASRTLRRFQFDVNCLMFFAALGAVALQEFTEAAAVTFLFSLSEWLEVRATARARDALSAIVHLRPEIANLVHPRTGNIVVVPAGAVPVGGLVSVRTGDKIPCDGVVVEGISTVDESSLTGESRPVRKSPMDVVSGGTVNSGNTQLMVRTTATADDSAVARLIRLVEEAQANRSETEKLVDEFARIYTPIVVLVALIMCSIPWAWGREVGATWTHNGLVLIVVACPCALIISTPVSYVAGLAATAQRGVLIKGGAHLEALGLVKKICFDKTGTLTQGKFQLLNLNVVSEHTTRDRVLEYLALMEERASHPLAQALVEAAQLEGVQIPKSLFVKDHTFLPGEGVSGTINGVQVHVGNTRLFNRLGLFDTLPDSEKRAVEDRERMGSTVGFMSIGDQGIVCSYCVADAVRPESARVLEKFRRMGIAVTMLTGDNNDTANAIGQQIGLSAGNIRSQLLPEEKLSIVSAMKDESSGGRSIFESVCSKRKLVLMCGDGVNDAPALATADVGVAMGAGAALAMETADVTLMDSHLSKLVYSVKMGRRVIRKIQENVVFSLAVKLLVLGFALAGKVSLWAAIAADVGAMILVTLNGMLLLPSRKKKESIQQSLDIESGKAEMKAEDCRSVESSYSC